jgi:hypothetical protein
LVKPPQPEEPEKSIKLAPFINDSSVINNSHHNNKNLTISKNDKIMNSKPCKYNSILDTNVIENTIKDEYSIKMLSSYVQDLSKNDSNKESDFSKNKTSENASSQLTKHKLMQIMEQRRMKVKKIEVRPPPKSPSDQAEDKQKLNKKLDNAFDTFPLSSDEDEDDDDEFD